MATDGQRDKTDDAVGPEARSAGDDGPARAIAIDRDTLAARDYITPGDRGSALAGDLRSLRARLRSRLAEGAPADGAAFRKIPARRNLVLVVSERAGAGKTYAGVNLALSAAFEEGLETLLVDANARRPAIASLFGIEDAPGFSDFCAPAGGDWRNAARRIEDASLWLMPTGGAAAENGPDGAVLSAALDTLSAAFKGGLIVIDGPALEDGAAARRLAACVDEVALVVPAGAASRASVRRDVDALMGAGRGVSLLLNRARFDENEPNPRIEQGDLNASRTVKLESASA